MTAALCRAHIRETGVSCNIWCDNGSTKGSRTPIGASGRGHRVRTRAWLGGLVIAPVGSSCWHKRANPSLSLRLQGGVRGPVARCGRCRAGWRSQMTQRAAVTGAGSGIGDACAEELGRRGLEVVCIGRLGDVLEQAITAIWEAGGKAIAAPADIASEQ